MNKIWLIVLSVLLVVSLIANVLNTVSLMALHKNNHALLPLLSDVEKVPLLVKKQNQLMAQFLYIKGLEELKDGNVKEATIQFSAAKYHDRSASLVNYQLAWIAFLNKDYEKSKQLVEEELLINENHVDSFMLKGAMAFQEGAFDIAIKSYQKAKELGFYNRDLVLNLSESYRMMGLANEASSLLEVFLEKYNDTFLHYKYYMALIALDRDDEVLDVLNRGSAQRKAGIIDYVLKVALAYKNKEFSNLKSYYQLAKANEQKVGQLNLLIQDPLFKGLDEYLQNE